MKKFLFLVFLSVVVSGCNEKPNVQADLACAKYFHASAEESNIGENKYLAIPPCMKAAENGSARAQFALGFLYLYGIGLEKNENQAVFWLKKSASQGIIEASNLLESLAKNISSDRYLCSTDKVSYFTLKQDQKNCRVDRLAQGWENLFFSKEQIFDFYNGGLSKNGNEVKIWSRMLFNSTKIAGVTQLNGPQIKIEFNELKNLLIFNCSSREYKNPNTVYFLDGEELHRTSDNIADVSPNDHTSYSFGYISEQIEPGTFVEALYNKVCKSERVP